MATIVHKPHAEEGGLWVVRHTEMGVRLEEEFSTLADAEVYKRSVEGPEAWELKAGPVIRNETYFGSTRTLDRHTVYYLDAGQRRSRTFGDADTAARFRDTLTKPAASDARARRRSGRRIAASRSLELFEGGAPIGFLRNVRTTRVVE